MEITELTVHELQEKLAAKELTITEITKAYVDRINEKEKDVQAFITLQTDEAMKKAEEIEAKVNKVSSYTTSETNAKRLMCAAIIIPIVFAVCGVFTFIKRRD